MSSVFFDIYGYKIEITGSDIEPMDLKINRDFAFFKTASSGDCYLSIHLANLANTSERGLLIGSTRMCKVRQVGWRHRQLIYRENSQVLATVDDHVDRKKRTVHIATANLQVLDDILYFLLNSTAGEYLDANGFMRIHALSFLYNAKAHIICGAPGAGKSTLAMRLLTTSGVQIYSDEISLLDLRTGMLRPYPIRIGDTSTAAHIAANSKFTYFFNTKSLMEIPSEKIATPAVPVKFFSIQKSNSRILCWIGLFFGLGLIQMREYLLRPDNIQTIFKILKNRYHLIICLSKCKFTVLQKNSGIEERLNSVL